jgi:hypothetical protein
VSERVKQINPLYPAHSLENIEEKYASSIQKYF